MTERERLEVALEEARTRKVTDSPTDCVKLLTSFIEAHPDVWNEDIGEAEP